MPYMLNVGKLRRGGENYYLNSVARGVEDYYLGSGEAPGYWLSSGSSAAGLRGQVGEHALRNILNARDPKTGELLLAKPRDDRVPGFDLTFRAPKSVALLHALGPKEASNEVVNAHDAAVAAALKYMESVASGARRGHAGHRTIGSDGFIAAGFRHRTSRAGDPLLHTHVLVANLLHGEDGKWGSLDARFLFGHAKTAGYLYQAHLRFELTQKLGVEWTDVHNGTADIEGIPRAAIEAFSTRRREIEAALGEGDTSAPAAQVAALQTRRAKNYAVAPDALLEEWREKAQHLGLTNEVLASTLQRSLEPVVHRDDIESDLASANGLTAASSTFSRREVIQGLCDRSKGGAKVAQVLAWADSFLDSPQVVRIDHARTADPRFTTPGMLDVELGVVRNALRRRHDEVGLVPDGVVDRAIEHRPSLEADQVEMVRRITTSGAGVEAVVGKAGTGKTFALAAAREAWDASGHEVIGCSLAARAAQELESGAGIRSHTLARLLMDLDDERSGGLPENAVIVVDEAAMVGTRDLSRLLDHAERSRSKVVLVGDDQQLPEIEAGGSFRGLRRRGTLVELSQVRRQPTRWERDALDLIRSGNAKEAMQAYLQRDRIVSGPSPEATRSQLVSDWWEAYRDEPRSVMIAARRSDVADLNARARHELRNAGVLGNDEVQVGRSAFSIGDSVMALRNDSHLGVINGTRGVVTGIDRDLRNVTIDTGRTSVTLPATYLDKGNLQHAYAITGHKAQGMTTDRCFVLADETLYREWAYVAMSRGRVENSLYVVVGDDAERDELGGQITHCDDPLHELERALTKTKAKELALDAGGPELELSLELS